MSDYDTDILEWSEHQAALLRRRASGELVNDAELDWANIAEEIESVGDMERDRLAERVGTVLEHLIKLAASPAVDPRKKWRITIRTARRGINRSIEKSRTLREAVPAIIAEEMPGAREDAAAILKIYDETPLVVRASQQAKVAAEAAVASARLLESEAGNRLAAIEGRLGSIENRITNLAAGQSGHELAIMRVAETLADHTARLTRIEALLADIARKLE